MNNKMDTNIKSRYISIRILVVLGLILPIVVAGCIEEEKKDIITPQKTPEQVTGVPTSQKTPDGISSGTEGLIEKYSLDRLVAISDSIIIGEVTDIRSEWNTFDGKRPENNNDSSYIIYTDVRIKVGECLKNPLGMATITVRVLGGIVGQDKLNVEDQPSYNVNEKVLVFLKKDEDLRTRDIGDQHLVTTGLIQGKVTISQNEDVIVSDEKMSLDDLRTRITGKGEKTKRK